MSTYSYTISGDFGGTTPEYEQLHEEIEDDDGITETLLGINSNDDDVDIVFESELLPSGVTALNQLVSAHAPENSTASTISNISISNPRITSSTYNTVATFNYPGIKKWSNTTNIKVISSMEDNGTSYEIKIYDLTHRKQICYQSFSNTNENINDMGILSNLPSKESIFEVQVKTNGSTIAFVKNVNIYHD